MRPSRSGGASADAARAESFAHKQRRAAPGGGGGGGRQAGGWAEWDDGAGERAAARVRAGMHEDPTQARKPARGEQPWPNAPAWSSAQDDVDEIDDLLP